MWPPPAASLANPRNVVSFATSMLVSTGAHEPRTGGSFSGECITVPFTAALTASAMTTCMPLDVSYWPASQMLTVSLATVEFFIFLIIEAEQPGRELRRPIDLYPHLKGYSPVALSGDASAHQSPLPACAKTGPPAATLQLSRCQTPLPVGHSVFSVGVLPSCSRQHVL